MTDPEHGYEWFTDLDKQAYPFRGLPKNVDLTSEFDCFLDALALRQGSGLIRSVFRSMQTVPQWSGAPNIIATVMDHDMHTRYANFLNNEFSNKMGHLQVSIFFDPMNSCHY